MKQQSECKLCCLFSFIQVDWFLKFLLLRVWIQRVDNSEKVQHFVFVSTKRHIHSIYLWTRIPTCWLDFHQSQFCSLYEYGCSPSAQLPSHPLITSCVAVNPCECGFAHEDFLSSLFSPVRWRMCQAAFLTKVGHHFLFLNCAGNKQYTHDMSVGAEGWELLQSYF